MTGPSRAADPPVKGGTLIWGHSETTQNLDIHQTGTASTLRVLQNVHDAIVTVDKNFTVIPSLAKSFEQSPDGLTYTFHLRPGVKFHDGKTMTSADVKYSFDRCRAKETGAVNFEVFNDVASIETPDDLTVVIKMKRVNAPFLSRLAENGAGAIMPQGSGDQQGKTPIGAGPFKFVRREFGHEVELPRFDDYWDGPAYLDKVIAREVTEPTVRLTGLRTGEMHMINDIPADRMKEVKSDPKFQVIDVVSSQLGLRQSQPRLSSRSRTQRVRMAIDLLIDKEALAARRVVGRRPHDRLAELSDFNLVQRALKNRAQDIEKAKALLAEAGYGPGKLDVVFKATTNYPYHVESAQIMLEWFKEAGINMKIEQLTWADWLSQVWVNKDFQISMMNFFTLWEPDFLYYSLWNSTGAFNYRHIKDPDHRRSPAEGARDHRSCGAGRHLQAGAAADLRPDHDVILWFRNGSIGAQPSVGGLDTIVHPNGSNLNFHKVWLRA